MNDTSMTIVEQQGRKFGAIWRDQWAEEADVPQLRESWDALDSDAQSLVLDPDDNSAWSPSEQVFFMIDPANSRERQPARDFWEEIADSLEEPTWIDDPAFLRAFIESALD